MVRFSNQLVAETIQPMWAALQAGAFFTDAAPWPARIAAGPRVGARSRRRAPAPRPRAEGSLPVVRRARGDRAGPRSWRVDARDRSAPGPRRRRRSRGSSPQHRSPRRGYRATTAHALAHGAPVAQSRPSCRRTRAARGRAGHLTQRYSPEQIAGRLRRQYPDDPEMWVSAETIYQSLYVQSRGALQAGADALPADRAGAARARPPGRPAQEPHPRHGQHRHRPPEVETARCPATGRATC